MRNQFVVRTYLSALGREGWYLPLLLLTQALPPYASRGYRLNEWGAINALILLHPIKERFAALFPIFQIIPLLLLAGVLLAGKRLARVFSIYVAVSYVLAAFLQNVAAGEAGLGVSSANLVLFLILAGLWAWEAVAGQNDFTPRKRAWWAYAPMAVALFAFWQPANPYTGRPDFNPAYLFTNDSGLSFCLVTPLFLAILSLFAPRVNRVVFAATAWSAFFLSLSNFFLEFVVSPSYWWTGVLHIPLFLVSIYCLALWMKDLPARAAISTLAVSHAKQPV